MKQIQKFTRPSAFAITLCLLLILTGCPKDAPERPQPSETAKAEEPDPLTVLVIDDETLAEPLARQWLAESNGKLTVINRTLTELQQQNFELGKDPDVILYPVDILGELESRKRIMPFSREVWQSSEYNKEELLRIFRSTIPRHHNETWGVPLGGAMLTLVFDQQVVKDKLASIPLTWDKLEELISQQKLAADSGFSFRLPLAEGWAAQIFLARSAALIRTRGRLSTVFERSDMRPLINTPPFRRALDSLKQMVGDDQAQLQLTPEDLFFDIAAGKTTMGITWPPARGSVRDGDSGVSSRDLGFASLPGENEWFDPRSGAWNVRGESESRQFDLVGFNGMLGSVVSSSRSTDDAFDFLAWLGNKSTPLKTLTYAKQSGPFRASHLANPSVWFTETLVDEAALRYGDVLSTNHERDVVFMFPRIPQRRQYLKLLDDNVRACLRGELEAEVALENTARAWEELTESLGRNRMINELAKDGGL